ncbi:hypothetical protein AB0B56_33660 [Streptosporangium canum]|uniref:hypothetical protein n=1 Tax=Streptosporangium canum TaxID=324952 RepID=UPI0034493C47
MGELTPGQLEARYRDWPPRSWYATRGRRRLLVGVGAGSAGLIWVSAIVCYYLAPSLTAMWTTFALTGAASVIYVVVYSALVGATRGVVGLAERHLDERQSRERQKIQANAHRGTTVTLVVLGVLLLSLAVPRGETAVQIPAAAIVMLVFGVIATHVILPSLMAGWQMSDPPPDDEDDPDDGDGRDDEDRGEDGRSVRAPGRSGDGQPIDGKTAT